MADFAPAYPAYTVEELAKLTEEQRKELKAAILQVLRTDPDIRRLLREKTIFTLIKQK
jgi:hypothetical protein